MAYASARAQPGSRHDLLPAGPHPAEGQEGFLVAMGLARGWRMKQEVYDDPHSLDVLDQRAGRRCFVTLLDALSCRELTDEMPPTKPPSAREYAAAGLPWFDYCAADLRALKGSHRLARTKSGARIGKTKGEKVLRDDGPARVGRIVQLGARRSPIVREAEF